MTGRRRALLLATAVVICVLALAACTGDAGTAVGTPTGTPSPAPAASSVDRSATPATDATAEATTPEEQAAAEAVAAYREARTERSRFNGLAVREAAARGGVYVLTPELDAIIQAVLVGRMYEGISREPQITLDTWPGVVDEIGAPEVGTVVVEEVELFDAPTTVEGREGVTGLVTVLACVDVTSIRPVDAGGAPLTPDPTAPRIQIDTTTVSRQPSPFTGQLGWYVSDSSAVEEATCPL
ncbi:MAG: hypothetical protein ACFCVG_08820 [Kineosporiaceae bacterium]